MEVGGTLEARDVRVHIRGVKAVDGVDLDRSQRRDPRADRAERRRQDHARQRPLRLPARDDRARRARRPRHHGVAAAPRSPAPGSSGRSRTSGCSRGSRVFENVEVGGALGGGVDGAQARAVACELLARSGSTTARRARRRRCPTARSAGSAIARALARRAAFLLLDEPAAGLNEPRRTSSSARSRRSGTSSGSACS